MKFAYRCRQADGTIREGILEAVDEPAARQALGQRGWKLVSLGEAPEAVRERAPVARVSRPVPSPIPRPKRPAPPALPPSPTVTLSRQDLSLLTLQVGTLTDAGVPIHLALGVVARAGSRRMQLTCEHLSQCVHQGATVSEALASLPQIFSPVMVSLVRIGEGTGRLVPILGALAASQAQEHRRFQRLVSALAYPLFALTGSSLLLALLVLVMLPGILPLLPHGPVPWPTRVLLALNFRMAPVLLGGVLLLGFLLWQASRTAEGARLLQQGLYEVPYLGPHMRLALWLRLSRGLALMLANGLSCVEALKVLRDPTCGWVRGDAVLAEVQTRLEDGQTMGEAFSGPPEVPRALVRLLHAAEEAGSHEQFLGNYADLCELEVESERDAFLTLLEPACLLGMGALVGFVVTAVFLPLYGALVPS